MKVKSVIAYATVILSSAFCYGQSNVVYYGINSNALNVVFVDTNLAQSTQSAIITDLKLCLQSEWGNQGELRLRDNEGFTGYLDFGRRSPHYPDGDKRIGFPKDIVSNGTAGVALQIPKELSDAYTNAFAFAVANPSIVKAAYEFVRFVSSTNFPGIPATVLPDYFFGKNLTGAEIISAAQQIIPDLGCQTYYPPSLLGFHHLAKGPGPATSNLFLNIPCSTSPYGSYKEWSGYPAIWHDGKWKFCSWDWFDDKTGDD